MNNTYKENIEKQNIEFNIFGVDIILPKNDTEGQEYTKKLAEKLEQIDFSQENKQIIQNALQVAKNWGTEEVKKFENENIKIKFQRRSGRTAFAHFVESAYILLNVFPKDFDENILAQIIASALTHDSVEDSKGLYNFKKLKIDLEKKGVSQEKIEKIINIVSALTFSQEEQELDLKGKKNQKTFLEGDNLEKNEKLVYYGMTETIVKLFPEIYNNNSGTWKNTQEYQKMHNLENEFTKIYLNYLKAERGKIELQNSGGKINRNAEEIRDYYLKQMQLLEQNMKKEFKTFLEKNIKLEELKKENLLTVLVRLSETITALGPTDIKGYGIGDYGIRNTMAKEVFYSSLLTYLEEKIKNHFGKIIHTNIKNEFEKYILNAKEYQKKKLFGEKILSIKEAVNNIIIAENYEIKKHVNKYKEHVWKIWKKLFLQTLEKMPIKEVEEKEIEQAKKMSDKEFFKKHFPSKETRKKIYIRVANGRSVKTATRLATFESISPKKKYI